MSTELKKPTREEFFKMGRATYDQLSAIPIVARRLPVWAEYERSLDEIWAKVEPMDADEFEVYCKIQQASSMPMLRSLEKGMELAIEHKDAYLASLPWTKRQGVKAGARLKRVTDWIKQKFSR